MVVVIFGGLFYAVWFYSENGYLPQPFFYDPHDTWMDWFNTSYWAHENGAYDFWGTLYPPLSFVFLKIFSFSACYANGADPYAVRRCDWLGIVTIHAFFVLNIFLLWKTFRKIDRSTALWRTLALGFGLPSATGLERANLVIVAFTFLILGFGPLLKSARWRWLSVAMAINFKIYLIAALFPQLIRRRWLWFEGAFLLTVAVYIVTFCIFGDGLPDKVVRNIQYLLAGYDGLALTDLWISASYNGFVAALESQYLLIAGHIGTRNVQVLSVVIPLLQLTEKIFLALAAVFAWFRPEAAPMHRLTFLGMAFAMAMSETQGYTAAYLIFLVMFERWEGFWKRLALIASYILLLPLDIPLLELPKGAFESYLAGHAVFVSNYVSAGHFLRPFFVIVIGVSMSMVTILDVWADIRLQGWSRRWRYRRDAPLLPGVLRPTPDPAR